MSGVQFFKDPSLLHSHPASDALDPARSVPQGLGAFGVEEEPVQVLRVPHGERQLHPGVAHLPEHLDGELQAVEEFVEQPAGVVVDLPPRVDTRTPVRVGVRPDWCRRPQIEFGLCPREGLDWWTGRHLGPCLGLTTEAPVQSRLEHPGPSTDRHSGAPTPAQGLVSPHLLTFHLRQRNSNCPFVGWSGRRRADEVLVDAARPETLVARHQRRAVRRTPEAVRRLSLRNDCVRCSRTGLG